MEGNLDTIDKKMGALCSSRICEHILLYDVRTLSKSKTTELVLTPNLLEKKER